MVKNLLYEILTLLNREQKISGLWLGLLTIIGSLLDFLSVFLFLPLVYLILNPDFVQSNAFVHSLYQKGSFNTHTKFLAVIIFGILLFIVFKNLIAIWITQLKAKYAFGLAQKLSLQSMLHYSQMDFSRFASTDFSKELNRITNYPFAFANNIVLPALNLISEIFIGLLIVAALIIYEPPVLIIIIAIIAPSLLIFQSRKTHLKKISDALKIKYPALLKTSLRMIEGFSEIEAFGKQKYFHSKFNEANKGVTDAFIKDHVGQTVTSRFTEIIVAITICVLILYAIATGETLEQVIFLLSVFATAGFRIVPSVNKTLLSLQQIQVNQHVVHELKLFQSKDPVQKNISSHKRMPFQKEIEFQNISFAYAYGTPILKNVSLTIQKGDKIAIQGKSGGGKTTLLLLMLRFLKETSGKVLVDGKNVFDEPAWRMNIGYVPQNPYILDGTILENIAFGVCEEDIDREKVTRLISDLRLDDLLNQLPDGLQTVIGERGAKLSGGQRQRIALARALYIDADILLLDEVTNQVHATLEGEILDILYKLSQQNKTIVLITHKLPKVNFFDVIYSLDNGVLTRYLEANPQHH